MPFSFLKAFEEISRKTRATYEEYELLVMILVSILFFPPVPAFDHSILISSQHHCSLDPSKHKHSNYKRNTNEKDNKSNLSHNLHDLKKSSEQQQQ